MKKLLTIEDYKTGLERGIIVLAHENKKNKNIHFSYLTTNSEIIIRQKGYSFLANLNEENNTQKHIFSAYSIHEKCMIKTKPNLFTGYVFHVMLENEFFNCEVEKQHHENNQAELIKTQGEMLLSKKQPPVFVSYDSNNELTLKESTVSIPAVALLERNKGMIDVFTNFKGGYLNA